MRRNVIVLHFISEPVVAQIQMFHASMVIRILGNRNGGLIVNQKSGWTSDRTPHLPEERAERLDFLASLNSSNVLCLCSRQSYKVLKVLYLLIHISHWPLSALLIL